MRVPLKLSPNSTYYNFAKPMSYNPYLMLIIGGRGIGKTTGAIIEAINEYNKNGTQFIYLRRYKTEIKKFVKKNSMNDICEAITYKNDGSDGYMLQCMGDTVGYGMSLSTASGYKSAVFPRVNLIIADEMILARGGTYHYLADEVMALLEFISTVFRTRSNCKVIILGNNASVFNPYFEYFDIPAFDGIYFNKERDIYCELAKNSQGLLDLEEKTGLFKLTNGTAYGEYHYNNKILSDTDKLLGEKPPNSKLIVRLLIDNSTVNIYTYYVKDDLYLYYELKEKIIEDDISLRVIDKGKPNYYYVNVFKNKYKNLILNRFYIKQNTFNSEKCNDIIGELVKII